MRNVYNYMSKNRNNLSIGLCWLRETFVSESKFDSNSRALARMFFRTDSLCSQYSGPAATPRVLALKLPGAGDSPWCCSGEALNVETVRSWCSPAVRSLSKNHRLAVRINQYPGFHTRDTTGSFMLSGKPTDPR